MLTESDKVLLKEILIKENPILFLGAGFSYGCKNKIGDLPMGDKLKLMVFDEMPKNILFYLVFFPIAPCF